MEAKVKKRTKFSSPKILLIKNQASEGSEGGKENKVLFDYYYEKNFDD